MNSHEKAKKKFTSDEISVFCNQMAMMMNSGIPVYEGVYILYSEMEDKKTKQVLKLMDDVMKDKGTFHRAIEHCGAFPDYMIHMVQIGEETGRLEDVLHSLSAYYERDSKVKASVKSAVAYPLVLFTMMTAIMVALVWKILPLFESMFLELNADVAEATRDVMGFGLNLGKIIAIVTCSILVLAILILLYYKTESGERTIKAIFSKGRLTGRTSELLAIGKFVSSMALMIGSGMDLQGAIDAEALTGENKTVRKKIAKCAEDLRQGKRLDETLRENKLIVGMEGRMLSIANRTGALDTLFYKMSQQYNEKITTSMNRLSTVIETVLVVVLSVLVAAVLLSVMLPLVSMISAIG